MAEDHADLSNTKPAAFKPHPRRRREAPIPKELRKDAVQHARAMAKEYRKNFDGDPKLKDRITRLMRALLPPRPRGAGRPRDPHITSAVQLHSKLRRQHPTEKPREVLPAS